MHRYLGTNPEIEISRVRAREPEWFALAGGVSEYVGEIIGRLNVPHGDKQKLLAALLFRRVAGAFEAVFLLAERGMYTEGLTSRRALLEALFVLGAIHNQPKLVEAYIAMDTHRRRDIFINIQKLSPKILNALAPELTPQILEVTAKELKEAAKGLKYLKLSDYAQAAKLYDTYLTDYSFLSEAAHHVAKDLERNISLDADGGVDGMYWGPEPELPSGLLLPAIEHTLIAVATVEKIFKLNRTLCVKKFRKQLQSMLESGQVRSDT